MAPSPLVRYELRGPAAWITLASAKARNALSAPLVAERRGFSAFAASLEIAAEGHRGRSKPS